jgi:hypothetical protein
VWRFQCKTAGETKWAYHDHPPIQDLLSLKEIVGRKYRRRRASIDDVASVEKLIQDRRSNE